MYPGVEVRSLPEWRNTPGRPGCSLRTSIQPSCRYRSALQATQTQMPSLPALPFSNWVRRDSWGKESHYDWATVGVELSQLLYNGCCLIFLQTLLPVEWPLISAVSRCKCQFQGFLLHPIPLIRNDSPNICLDFPSLACLDYKHSWCCLSHGRK
jgi:hypothetical protein